MACETFLHSGRVITTKQAKKPLKLRETLMRYKRKSGGGRKEVVIENTMEWFEVYSWWFDDMSTGVIRCLRSLDRKNYSEVVSVENVIELYCNLEVFSTKNIQEELCLSKSQAHLYMQVIKLLEGFIARFRKTEQYREFLKSAQERQKKLKDSELSF